MNSATPYISVVMAARNDDYGGGFQERLFRAVSHLAYEFALRDTSAEIIVVEWNPDPTAPPLVERLQAAAKPTTPLRVITVPSTVHASLPNSEHFRMFEYRAKNVGLRRAAGQFLLVMNPDIILNSQVHDCVSRRGLAERNFYRADRLDLTSAVKLPDSSEQLLQWCELNWVTRLAYWGAIPRASMPRRLLNSVAYLTLPMRGGGKSHPHLHASGDFLLMHNSAWRALRGYKEATSNDYIDGLMVLAALSLGLEQMIRAGNWAVFHQYHDPTAKAGRPSPPMRQVLEPGYAALRSGSVYIANDEDWGLPDALITEVVL